MKLSGKCKEDFEKYLMSNVYDGNYSYVDDALNHFNDMPKSMQWGVIQDFADSENYEIVVEYGVNAVTDKIDGFDYVIRSYSSNGYGGFSGYKDTRQEARIAAVEKFNELYNSK